MPGNRARPVLRGRRRSNAPSLPDWRSVYYILQPDLNLMLVNPQHLKGIRGRKTDPSDAAFLARAAASGMVLASFVAPQAIRELRDLTRRRTELAVMKGQEVQRLEKELEDTGMKLTSVLTDVLGTSGRAILAALIDGQRDPHVLADLAVANARKKIDALVDALDGTFTDHHATPNAPSGGCNAKPTASD